MDSGNFRPPNPGQGHSREQQALQEHIDPILNLLRGNNPRQQQPRGYSSSNAINSSPGWHEQQQHGLGSSHGAPPASDYESISDKGNLLHQQQDQRRQQQQQQQQHIAQAHSQHSTRAELEQAVQFANNKHQHQARAQPPSINSNSNTNNQANQDRSQHASYHQLPSVASALLGSMRSQSEQQLTPSGGGGNWPISPTCLLAAAGHHHHHHHHQALHAHNPALYGNPHAPAPSPSSSCANSPASVGDIYAHQQQQHIHRVFQSMLHGGHQAAAQQQQQLQQRQVLRDSSSGSTTTAAQALQLPSHLLPAHLPPVATPFDLYSTLQSYAALTHTYMSRGAFGSALAMTSSAPGLLHHLPSATVAALQGTFPAVAAQTPSALPAPANIGDSETLPATNAAANDDDNDMLDDDDDDDEDDDDDDRTIKRGHNCQDHYRNRRHSQAARVGPLESVARTRANLFESKRQQHHHRHHHASGTTLEACTMSAPPAIAHNRTSENVEQLSPRFAAGARSNSLRGVASTATIRESHQHSSLGRATGRNSSPPRLTMPTFRVAGKGVGARQSNSGDDDESTTRVVSRTYQRDQNRQACEYNDDTTTDDDVKMSSISIDDDDNDNDEDGDNNANRDKQKDKEGARGDEQKVRDDDAFGGGSSGSTPCNSGRIRTAYSSMQILNLEREFAQNMYLSRIRRIELAQKLSLSEKQVKIWFQNRRVKYKKENPA